ncbi:MAG: hypothetical protein RL226_1672 [Bacteroidota bacterium]|jgi:uncharacterized protein (TIGR00661 family)
MAPLKLKTFLSDEGYGHIVRQRAVIESLKQLHPGLDVTLQTSRHLDAASRLVTGVRTIDRYNNISWAKEPSGSPDVEGIREIYLDYEDRSNAYLEVESSHWNQYDFLVSDFVYEVFPLGRKFNVPAFGVAHFTWDWFFAKLYPPPLSSAVMSRFLRMAKEATALYFPPFTPEEILKYYRHNAIQVPLIMRSEIAHKTTHSSDCFRVLIVDSGAGVLRGSILKALKTVAHLDDFRFFVSGELQVEQDNVSYIDKNELMVDYIGEMDLVIGRAGFNTISECIGLRTPMLLLGEAMNPEMSENIINIKKVGLGTFISMDVFENGLGQFLPHFLKHEYKSLQHHMEEHAMPLNGAQVIATDILNRIL